MPHKTAPSYRGLQVCLLMRGPCPWAVGEILVENNQGPSLYGCIFPGFFYTYKGLCSLGCACLSANARPKIGERRKGRKAAAQPYSTAHLPTRPGISGLSLSWRVVPSKTTPSFAVEEALPSQGPGSGRWTWWVVNFGL